MQTPSAKPYLVNRPFDLLIACGGLSLLLFPFLVWMSGPTRSALVIQIAFALAFVVNYPHFAATIHRLYHNRENRDNYPFTTYVFPVILLGLTVIAFMHPQSFGAWYCKVFLLWSGYHYSGQSVGISLIYARRNNFPVSPIFRVLLTLAIYSTYFFPTFRAEASANPRPFYGIMVPSLELPQFLATASQVVLIGSWAALLTYLILASRYTGGRRVPFSVFLPALTQFCWFIPGSYSPMFYEFVPLFHGLQYLLIVAVFHMKEVSAVSQRSTFFEFVKYALALGVMGALLFRWIPDGLSHFGTPLNIAEPLWIATVQIHHFWTDGVIWKLRHPHIASKLLTPHSSQSTQLFFKQCA